MKCCLADLATIGVPFRLLTKQGRSMVASHRYEVRVAGVVPPQVLLDFDHLRISAAPVVTVICGSLPDQAALHALLDRLEMCHVQLLEFRRCHGPTEVSAEAAQDP